MLRKRLRLIINNKSKTWISKNFNIN
jgi:hypothetical protein